MLICRVTDKMTGVFLLCSDSREASLGCDRLPHSRTLRKMSGCQASVTWLTSISSFSKYISFLLLSIILRSTATGINVVVGLFILLGFPRVMEFDLLAGWQECLGKVNGAGAHRGC